MPRWTKEKLAELRELLTAGKTVMECADHYDRSRAAIYDAINLHLGMKSGEYGQGRKGKVFRRQQRELLERVRTDLNAAKRNAFENKARNARRGKWEFTIAMTDIEWPSHCPVLGIELDWFSPCRTEGSPSFDRIDPSKGYIPGNVAIISWRANRIKNDGTADEHAKIAGWMSNLSTQPEIPR
jgi:transposase